MTPIRSAFMLIAFVISSCGSAVDHRDEISQLESSLQKEPNQDTLEKLVELYLEMAEATQGDERLEYTWKAGEAARSARNFPVAETSFKTLYEQYPDSPQASKALFLHAFMSDEDLKAYDKARTLYQTFIERYPDSDFNDDAQFLLENLGKSDEEMLEMLTKRNQQAE
ncbi:MAG: tetratricopeptide repeat protein [Saprospiraceae bacterium]|nr:tetratricopeptide repeat protein [Saprospiraceae bacterium]